MYPNWRGVAADFWGHWICRVLRRNPGTVLGKSLNRKVGVLGLQMALDGKGIGRSQECWVVAKQGIWSGSHMSFARSFEQCARFLAPGTKISPALPNIS